MMSVRNLSFQKSMKGKARSTTRRGSGKIYMAITNSSKKKWVGAVTSEVAERPRLQIDFTPEAFQHLSNMKERANVKSTAEVARNALRLYDWYLEKQREGYQILIAKGDTVKQVEFLL
jgi:hypothetical protein